MSPDVRIRRKLPAKPMQPTTSGQHFMQLTVQWLFSEHLRVSISVIGIATPGTSWRRSGFSRSMEPLASHIWFKYQQETRPYTLKPGSQLFNVSIDFGATLKSTRPLHASLGLVQALTSSESEPKQHISILLILSSANDRTLLGTQMLLRIWPAVARFVMFVKSWFWTFVVAVGNSIKGSFPSISIQQHKSTSFTPDLKIPY